MHDVRYWYSFGPASWDIPCKILNKISEDRYQIKYVDPIFGTTETYTVNKDQLIFPKFADMVI